MSLLIITSVCISELIRTNFFKPALCHYHCPQISSRSSGWPDVQSVLAHPFADGLWKPGLTVLDALSLESLGVGRPPWASLTGLIVASRAEAEAAGCSWWLCVH